MIPNNLVVPRRLDIISYSSPVSEAIKDREMPVVYIMGEKYIEAMKGLAASPNSKMVMRPADLPAAVRGILSSLGK